MQNSNVCTLMYHDVYEISNKESGFNIDSNYPYKLRKDVFESQIKSIAEYIETHGIDENYVQFSFDDGGVSFYTIIMPILEHYGFRGYFFIATKYIGQDGFLSESMIKEMSDRGHFIGAHSHTHRQRMNDLSFDDLSKDWSTCVDRLSNITGKPCIVASLPNGFTSKTILKVLKNVGIKDLYTSDPSEELKLDGELAIRGRYGIRNTMKLDDVLAITFDKNKKSMLRRKKVILNIAKKLMGNSYIKIREFIFKHK